MVMECAVSINKSQGRRAVPLSVHWCADARRHDARHPGIERRFIPSCRGLCIHRSRAKWRWRAGDLQKTPQLVEEARASGTNATEKAEAASEKED